MRLRSWVRFAFLKIKNKKQTKDKKNLFFGFLGFLIFVCLVCLVCLVLPVGVFPVIETGATVGQGEGVGSRALFLFLYLRSGRGSGRHLLRGRGSSHGSGGWAMAGLAGDRDLRHDYDSNKGGQLLYVGLAAVLAAEQVAVDLKDGLVVREGLLGGVDDVLGAVEFTDLLDVEVGTESGGLFDPPVVAAVATNLAGAAGELLDNCVGRA